MPAHSDESAERSAGGEPERVLGYANAETGQMQPIARFEEGPFAHLAASRLEAEGIPCVVSGATRFVALGLPTSGGMLMVAPEDVPAAVAVLAQTPARRNLLAEARDLPPLRVAEADVCPECAAEWKRPAGRKWIVAVGTTAILLAWLVWLGPPGLVLYITAVVAAGILTYGQGPRVCGRCGRVDLEEKEAVAEAGEEGALEEGDESERG